MTTKQEVLEILYAVSKSLKDINSEHLTTYGMDSKIYELDKHYDNMNHCIDELIHELRDNYIIVKKSDLIDHIIYNIEEEKPIIKDKQHKTFSYRYGMQCSISYIEKDFCEPVDIKNYISSEIIYKLEHLGETKDE